MSVLEWILLLETIAVVLATIFWGVALVIARNFPEDPIFLFTKAFWTTFLYPAPDVVGKSGSEMRPRGGGSGGVGPKGGSGGAKGKGAPSAPAGAGDADEKYDATYGRVKPGADGVVHTANLNIVVLPHSEKDDVLGRTSDGIELQVTSAAEDGASNKAVIQLVSKALGVKPYQVTLTKGHYQTRKAVAITGMDQAQLDAKLDEIG